MTMLVSSDHTQQNHSLSPDSNNDSKNNQQQQQLTLDIICPMWARRLEQSKHLSPLSLTRLRWYFELQRISRCVVAEAYGFSSSYMSDCKKWQQDWLEVYVLLYVAFIFEDRGK